VSKGFIEIDQLRCKGCGLCVTACKPHVISMAQDTLNVRGYHPAQYTDPENDCTACAACAVICPDVCISVYRTVAPKLVHA